MAASCISASDTDDMKASPPAAYTYLQSTSNRRHNLKAKIPKYAVRRGHSVSRYLFSRMRVFMILVFEIAGVDNPTNDTHYYWQLLSLTRSWVRTILLHTHCRVCGYHFLLVLDIDLINYRSRRSPRRAGVETIAANGNVLGNAKNKAWHPSTVSQPSYLGKELKQQSHRSIILLFLMMLTPLHKESTFTLVWPDHKAESSHKHLLTSCRSTVRVVLPGWGPRVIRWDRRFPRTASTALVCKP